ncbi:MAG: hypothetical protein HY796_00935 [Elusimicrobia bacterium]|nr:hypothetical protein [Elusimicrobiota bacterium]
MKLKYSIILFLIILSMTMIFPADLFLSLQGGFRVNTPDGDYTGLMARDLVVGNAGYLLAYMLSAILFIAMIVMIRRAYNRRLKRLALVATPILPALFFHYLLRQEIDVHIYYRSYRVFFDDFFANLPYAIPAYLIIGLVLFLIVMLTCYPVGMLIDKLLLYLTSKIPKHSQG